MANTTTTRTVIECALRDDPQVSADTICEIWADATHERALDAEVAS